MKQLSKTRLSRIIITLAAILFLSPAGAQVDIHINSGNPAFPFPQFIPYEYSGGHSLGNLGTKNAPGVVHAEMEQDIRDAYRIMANRFVYTGVEWGGVKYVRGNIGCPYDCSEGDGYALLAAAIMADKPTFDGLWMRTHDLRRALKKSYEKCETISPGYDYGDNALAEPGGNTATDGDVDIALALYIAWRQWGDYMGINDACGNPISYRKEMIEVIEGMVEIHDRFKDPNDCRRTSGNVGLDGYLKNGDTWTETTDWASNQWPCPEYKGPQLLHIDYVAPAYFRTFQELLESKGKTGWNVDQYKRAEASSDWLIGEWIYQDEKNIPWGGWVEVVNNKPIVTSFMQGEDFRTPWRTILNYVWHGNPEYTWNPVTHQVDNIGNTYEYDAAVRHVQFLNSPQAAPWGNPCVEFGGGPPLTYQGPATLQWDISPSGMGSSAFTLNWIPATGTPAAVAAQDYDLMGLLYRQCNIEWDVEYNGDGYITSKPVYFHEWFRLLGMLVVTGNHISPTMMLPEANMKVYKAIKDSVTFAYTGDRLTYVIDYRNYGAVDAQNVKIVENVPSDFVFESAIGGGVYDANTHTVTWQIGTVPGFKTNGLDITKGQVSYNIRIGDKAGGRYCTTAEITCSNGTGWVSNEYPNHITPTMQRNCVDIIARALQISKTSDAFMVNDDNPATFHINFENSAEAGWIDGGRPRVNIGFAFKNVPNPASHDQLWLYARVYNDAVEPYINYGNYRISYYMYDAGLSCYAGGEDCPVGWGLHRAVYEGGDPNGIAVSHENIVEGRDGDKRWNQRLTVQFAPLLVTTTTHLSNYFGMRRRVHRGGTEPMRGMWYLYPSDWTMANYSDDWSFSTNFYDAEDGPYWPVSPSWQDLSNPGIPIDSWMPNACEKASKVVTNILVEEFDGYVWRRILGTGPMPGRDITNVIIKDTLPKGLAFDKFLNDCPLEEFGATIKTEKTQDGRDIITWSIPKLQVKQKGRISYLAIASFPSGKSCETEDELILNEAWIQGDKESPISDTASITVTCGLVIDKIISTTLFKTADKAAYAPGDEIEYSIKYIQNDGSIAKPDLLSMQDWSGTGWSVKDEYLQSAGTVTGNIHYDYTYGTNGYIEFTCVPAIYAVFQVLLRDGSGQTISLQVKPLTTSQMELTTFVNGTVREAKRSITYGRGNPFTMRINLSDDIMNVWINRDTSSSPIYSVDNLPIGLGYSGFKNGNMSGGDAHGSHQFNNIHYHFDTGYNLSIIDDIPDEITYTSAQNNGNLVGNQIVWDIPSGKANPILYGTEFVVTWKGLVDNCNQKFLNIAHVSLMGHESYSIKAQAISDCGNLCPLPASLSITGPAGPLCGGVSGTVAAGAVTGGSYEFSLLLGGSPTGNTNATGEFEVEESGSYSIKAVYPGLAGCESLSPAVTVTAVADPGFSISSQLTGCLTGPAITPELSPAASGASWELGGSSVTVLSPSSLGVGSWELSATVEIDGCPFTASGIFAVTETPAPVPAQANYSALLGTENPLMEALPATGAAISWFAGEYANYSPELAAANSYRSLETALGKYPYYIAQQIDGCWSGYAEIELEIYDCPASAPVLQPADPYCPADASNLELASFINSTPGAGRADWFIADGTTPAALDYSVPAGSSLEFYARGWSDAGSCYGPVAKLELSAHPVPEPEILLGASICYLGSYPIAAGTGWDFSLNGAAHPHTDIDPVRDGISPNIAGNLLEWTYTDPATGCNASGSHTFSAALPDAPSAAPVTESEQNLPHPELEAVGAGDITWYSGECTTSIGTGNKLVQQFTATTDLWLNQEIGGCRSRCVETSITINPCGLPAPVLLKATENICVGDALPVFSVLPETGISYNWDGPAGAHTGETYTIAASAPGPYTATVRAWDGSCLSAPATATLNVNALPVPTLTVPAQICSGQAQLAEFSPAPNGEPGTSFSINGTPAPFGADLGAYQGSLSLEYTYQAAEGCSASVAAATEIIKIGAPSAMSETELLSGSPTGLLDAGQTVNWYDENGAFLVSASTYTHPDVSVTGVWVYKISVSASGCESPKADFRYEITDCPVPAPGITAPTEVCAGSPAELQADIISGTVINWYAPGGGLLHTGEVFTTGPLAEGAHSFTARRTDGCEGAGRTVTVTAVSTPAPAVTLPAKQEICEGETPPAFSYSGSSASISWRLGHGGNGAEVATGSSFVPVSPAVGVNPYSLVVGPAQCPSPAADFTLTVNTVPAAPVIAPPADACYMQQHQPAGTSTGQAGLRWYFDAAGLYEIPATAGLAYAPAPSASAVTVYAASVENGCRSQTAPVDYRWRSSVPLPVFSDVSSCHDLPMPQPVPVNASPLRELQWQAQGASAWLPGPVELQRESATIRARFIDAAGCEGSVSEFTFNYINPPVPEISLQKYSLCEGAGGELKGQLKVQGQYAGLETGLPNGSIETGLSFSYYAQPAYEGSYKSRSYALMPGGQRCYSSYSQPADFALEGAPAKPTFVLYGPYCYGSEIWLGLLPAATARLGLAPWAQELPQIAGITGTYDIGKYFSKPEAVTFYAWTDNGCASDTAIIELTVNAVPFPEITASGAPFIERGENGQRIFTVCEGGDELPSLQAYYEGAAISWLYNPASPIAGGSGTSMAVLPAPDSIGSAEKLLYILRAEKEGCLLEQTIGYAARPLPKPRILAEGIYTAADTVCAADPRRLYYIENYSEGRNIDWLGLESLDIISAQRVLQESPESISASFTGTGTDTLMLRELLDGCADTAKLPVRVLAKPRAEASYWLDPMSGTGHFTNLSLAPSGDSYGMGFSWTFPAGRRVQSWESYLSAEEQASSFGPGPHSVWLAVYSPAGPFCHDSLRLDIDMPAVKGLHIPTALHPGSGGIKSQWKPSGFNLKSYEAWIFDSWGNLVWHSDKLKDGRPADSWSGTDKWGNPLKGDVYFYRIKAEFYDGTKWETDSRKTRDRILLIR
jgi:uncharacterized repeat protein (TIGR01451 family)